MKTRVMQEGEPDRADAPQSESPPPKSTAPTNLTGRMGAWSTRHRKTAIFGWLAFVIAAFALGNASGVTMIDENTSGVGESGRGDRILDAGFERPAAESVLIQSSTLSSDDPAFRAAVQDVVTRVSKVEAVQNLRSPIGAKNADQLASDGRAALVEFEIRGNSDHAVDKIAPVLAAVAAAQAAHPELFIGEFGDASVDKEIEAAFLDDLKKA